jgi:hypothetical protein
MRLMEETSAHTPATWGAGVTKQNKSVCVCVCTVISECVKG